MDILLNGAVSNSIAAAALALFIAGLTKAWRSPQLAHALWLLVLVKLVTPPLYEVPLPVRLPSTFTATQAETPADLEHLPSESPPAALVEAVAYSGQLPSGAADPERSVTRQPASSAEAAAPDSILVLPAILPAAGWQGALSLVWGIGVIVAVAIFRGRLVRFRRLLAESVEADASLTGGVEVIAKRLGLRALPEIRVLDARFPPLVCTGWRKSLLVVPERLLSCLDRQQRDAVLVHELAHLRRYDHLVRWFEISVCLFFWWNPVAWWASRNLRRAEEECCDAWVLWALPEGRRSYGKALLWTVEFLAECPPLRIVGAALGGSHIGRRIEMIVNRKLNHRMSWSALAVVLVLGACVLPVAAQKPVDDARALDDVAAAPKSSLAEPLVEEGPKTATERRDLEARIEELERRVRALSAPAESPAKTAEDQGPSANGSKWSVEAYEKAMLAAMRGSRTLETSARSADNGFRVVTVAVKRPDRPPELRLVHMDTAGRHTDPDPELVRILNLTLDSWNAAGRRDSSMAEKLLAEDYFGIYSTSAGVGRSDKGTTVAGAKRRRYFEPSLRDIDARWIGKDAAIVTYVYDCKVEEGGATQTYRNHQATEVWTRKDGEWLVSFSNDFILPGGE